MDAIASCRLIECDSTILAMHDAHMTSDAREEGNARCSPFRLEPSCSSAGQRFYRIEKKSLHEIIRGRLASTEPSLSLLFTRDRVLDRRQPRSRT